MNTLQPFSGFPKEALRFYKQLENNNDREWFAEHKQVYQECVLEPAQAFVLGLGERLKSLSKGLRYDPRTNGSGSIMRIYRDIRFSKDKSPYKTNLGIVFWESDGKKTEGPGYYFHMNAKGAMMYAGLHDFPKAILPKYRDAVVDKKMGAELEAAIKSVRAAGDYVVGGEHYKRVPRGYADDHPRADLLRHNSLFAHTQLIDAAALSNPDLIDLCFEHCHNMLPIHKWLVKLFNTA